MGLYHDDNGLVVEVDDNFARSHNYTPAAPDYEDAQVASRAQEIRADDRGALGDLNAALTGVASSLTLGGSDMLLAHMLTDTERQRASAEIEGNQIARGVGEVSGALLGALANPATLAGKTPAGFLSNVAAKEVEHSLARGGAIGTAKALGVMGTEGAIQNAGQYLGHAALADKPTTVEGMAGALGTGFIFGGAGGGAALGISKGTIAARKMFSKIVDGGKEAAVAAEAAWSKASQDMLDADTATAAAAKAKLDDLRRVREVASIEQARANARVKQEEVYAARAEKPQPPITPPNAKPIGEQHGPFENYGPVEPVRDQYGPFENYGPAAPEMHGPVRTEDAGLPSVTSQDVTRQIPREQLQRVRGEAPPAADVTDLERQLAGTADGLAKGKSMAQMRESTPAAPTPHPLGKSVGATEDELMDALSGFEQAKKQLLDSLGDDAAHAMEAGLPRRGRAGEYEVPMDFAKRYGDDPLNAPPSIAEPTVAGKKKPSPVADVAEDIAEKAGEISDAPLTKDDLKHADEVSLRAEAITNYERASAKLARVVGDQAHPASVAAADALDAAEKEATQAMTDRMMRAAEDAEHFGPYENYGPERLSGKQRVDYAKARKGEVDLEYANLKTQEKEASMAYDAAQAKADTGEELKAAALKTEKPTSAKPSGKASKFADAGSALELLDLPGIPKPSDIPLVGPMLGAYLKYRGIKTVMNRFAGRVPATANTRVAALAAKTRDRIGASVERMLGVTERNAKYATKFMPEVTALVSQRIFDDGRPDVPPDASFEKKVGARIREVDAYLAAPNAIEMDVRRQLRGVTDPAIIAQAEKFRRAMFEYLQKHAPPYPLPNPFTKIEWAPNPSDAMKWARRYHAANDPASVYEAIEHEQAMITLEAAQTIRAVYPSLFQMGQAIMLDRAQRMANPVPFDRRNKMSILFDVPLDASHEPDNIKILQSVYERKPTAPQGGGPASPMPSVAGPVNLTALYQNPADRRGQ